MGSHKLILRHLSFYKNWNNCRFYTSLTNVASDSSIDLHVRQDFLKSPFRCVEDNPTLHTSEHEGKFYQIKGNQFQKLFTFAGCHKEFKTLVKTFQESCIMVRKPALEIMDYFKKTNFDLPVNRFILYGDHGVGKTMTLAHMVHFISSQNDWLLVHGGWVPRWIRLVKETAPSSSRPGRLDLPIDGVTWLQHFKLQNSRLLGEKNLCIENTYTWSLREKTEKGEHLNAIIEQGISRPKFASDCVAVILKEAKLLAKAGHVKVAVVVDGVNSVFYQSRFKRDNKSLVHANDVTMVRAFRKMMLNDWNNGIVITSVDTYGGPLAQRHSFLPRYLLTKEGFETMDPFIPIQVENYSLKEVNSCIDYYIDRLYIASEKGKTERGRQHLIFLSGRNPLSLENLCAPL